MLLDYDTEISSKLLAEIKYLNNLSTARSREIEIMRNTLNKQLEHYKKILTTN